MTEILRNHSDLDNISLDDKYDLTKNQVYLTGSQAIVRLSLLQKERDRAAGWNTAGYVIGYRGSPLGGIDQQFWKAKQTLLANDIIFEEGINEDLAATALWGTQQATIRGEGKVDGVFGIWYGKGPGVDRTGDVFRHANHFGTHDKGGVLALMGDDHTMESSTVAHASEFAFIDASTPIFNPAGLQEILDYGIYGWGLSRFTGLWAALKCVKDTVESTGSVISTPDRVKIIIPEFEMPLGGLNIRANDNIFAHEERLFQYKLPAALAFIRANNLNKRMISGGKAPKIGIITTGKSYLDTRQALEDLGLDEHKCNSFGVSLLKIGCPFPLVKEDIIDFAKDLSLIIVVEEKRAVIEPQVKDFLYGTANAPAIIGKYDEKGAWLFPIPNALDVNEIAIALGERVLDLCGFSESVKAKLENVKASQTRLKAIQPMAMRIPYFCSGCPHNTSTKVPEGARAYAGIGCHYMSQWMDRSTEGFTHMGGEGANWVGEAPFSTRNHMFQNLGDGTYNHSGSMAIRFSVGTKTNVTYKILYNDAVAMTGGQKHDGGLTVDQIARQVAAEGVKRIAIVTDEPDKYDARYEFPKGATIHGREQLAKVQLDLSAIEGVTVLIYDQTCAAEKRRRRKRGEFPDPDKRVIINELVCEGCGDCGVASNCVSVQPVETELGRKRVIDQSSCNKDFSCVNGFCPSFVTVAGAKIKKPKPKDMVQVEGNFPEPVQPSYAQTYNIIVTGIGGTGIVTVGSLLGMAAHLEHKGVGIIDMAGLAQKGGEVFSHLRIARTPEDINAIRINNGTADLIFGGEMVVAGSKKVLAAIKPNTTKMVVNVAEIMPGDFTRNVNYSIPTMQLKKAIHAQAGEANTTLYNFHDLATQLLGNSIASNLMMVGFAFQKGFIPLSSTSIVKAIELNNEAVSMNLAAFALGRQLAHEPAIVLNRLKKKDEKPKSIEERIALRVAFLTDYQNEAYAQIFTNAIAPFKNNAALLEAAAVNLFKLMAIKDEYEVARLFTNGAFANQLENTFDGDLKLKFHLSPPLFASKDEVTGLPKKMELGGYMLPVFKLLAKAKFLRGSAIDIFGKTQERKMELRLRDEYLETLKTIANTPNNEPLKVQILNLPQKVKGYGHVKEKAVKAYDAECKILLAQLEKGEMRMAAE